MILQYEQMKYLEVAGEEDYRFNDKGKATEKEKEELRELDEANVFMSGKHLIVNYKDLY